MGEALGKSMGHVKQVKYMSPLSIPSEPGGESFIPFLLLHSRWKECSGICPGWWAPQPGHAKQNSIPESYSDGKRRTFFQNKSYWVVFFFFNASLTLLFLWIFFRCIPCFGQTFTHAADSTPWLHWNFVPQIIPFFTPAYLFFNAVFCFFFHYKSNTISLEVYGNKTHYHIYKYFQFVPAAFPRALCR